MWYLREDGVPRIPRRVRVVGIQAAGAASTSQLWVGPVGPIGAAHRDMAIQHAVLAISICFRRILVGLAERVGKVAAAPVHSHVDFPSLIDSHQRRFLVKP